MQNIIHKLGGEYFGPKLDFNKVTQIIPEFDSRLFVKKNNKPDILNLFIALPGEKVNGEDFIDQAIQNGANCILSTKDYSDEYPNICFIKANNPPEFLTKFASMWRQKFNIPAIAITGSCGKTTVTKMLFSILKKSGPTLAPEKNYNNQLGVCHTLLRLNSSYKYLISEIGTNNPGEIKYLTKLVKPELACVVSVHPAHLKGLGSITGIAQEKSDIYSELTQSGIAILNQDIEYQDILLSKIKTANIITYSLNKNLNSTADFTGEYKAQLNQDLSSTVIINQHEFKLNLLGEHNLANLLACVAIARSLNLKWEDIQAAVSDFMPVAGRMKVYAGKSGAKIIDDSYNANPGSVTAAICAISNLPGTKWLVLGDMGELGDTAKKLHANIGLKARELNIDRLFTIGNLVSETAKSFGANAIHYTDQKSLLAGLQKELQANQNAPLTILVKGSRSAKMENIWQKLI